MSCPAKKICSANSRQGVVLTPRGKELFHPLKQRCCLSPSSKGVFLPPVGKELSAPSKKELSYLSRKGAVLLKGVAQPLKERSCSTSLGKGVNTAANTAANRTGQGSRKDELCGLIQKCDGPCVCVQTLSRGGVYTFYS